MFEPTTFYEKRLTLLEDLVMAFLPEVLPDDKSGPYFGGWNERLNDLKRARAFDLIAPLSLAVDVEQHATPEWLNKLVGDQLDFELARPSGQAATLEEASTTIRDSMFIRRVCQKAPSLDDRIGPDTPTGFYAASVGAAGNETLAPLLFLNLSADSVGVQRYVLAMIESTDIYLMELSPTMMPANFDWIDEKIRPFWRNELYPYLGLASQNVMAREISNALLNLRNLIAQNQIEKPTQDEIEATPEFQRFLAFMRMREQTARAIVDSTIAGDASSLSQG